MLPVRILGTSSFLPGRRIPTRELALRAGKDPADVERKTGIRHRHWIDTYAPGDCSRYGARALREALDEAGLAPADLRRLIFVSSVGGDRIFPATANTVAAELGIAGTCDAFDLNNACMGFLSALDLAARSVVTGLGPVGVVVVEIGLNLGMVTAEDPRPFLVFGEGVAAAVVGPAGSGGGGVLGVHLSNDGTQPAAVVMECPTRTSSGRPAHFEFTARNVEFGRQAMAGLLHATRAVVEGSGARLAEIEWIVPHQPNGAMLAAILDTLGIDQARTVPIVEEAGSIGAASIPVGLDRLLHTRPVRPGHRILMLGIGAGVSRGALLYQVGEPC